MKPIKLDKILTTALIIFGTLVLCMLIFDVYLVCHIHKQDAHMTDYGEVGNFISGIVGTFIALIAAFLTFIAFWAQFRANQLQRQDIKVERFNANFYNLLSLHEQITNSLECHEMSIEGIPAKREMIKGRDVFQYTYNARAEKISTGLLIGMRNRIIALGMSGYMKSVVPSYFDHYFRNLYRIVKYVDETDVFDDLPEDEKNRKKYEYVAILRSTLSRYELVWLFYNSLSDYGYDKFKPLMEKYAMLKNLRFDLLVTPKGIKDVIRQYDAKVYGGDYPEY
ncbi:MAG: putative phage abortive infection protein [Paludibacteraceae bacterium]